MTIGSRTCWMFSIVRSIMATVVGDMLHLRFDGDLELLDSVLVAPVVHPVLQYPQSMKSRGDKSGEWGAHGTSVLRLTCPDRLSLKIVPIVLNFSTQMAFTVFVGALENLLSSTTR